MKPHLIAVIKDDDNEIQGYRILYDIGASNIATIALINDIRINGVELENAKLDGDKIVGTNGSIDRYPVIVRNQLVSKSAVTVLTKLNDGNYKVSDFKGVKATMNKSQLVAYAKANGIANGKVVSNGISEFISAINGEYQTENVVPETQINMKSHLGFRKDKSEEKGELGILVEGVSESFNEGVVRYLKKKGIQYVIEQEPLDSRWNRNLYIDVVKFKCNIKGRDYIITQGSALERLTGDRDYYWYTIGYISDEYGKILKDMSDNKEITSRFIEQRKITGRLVEERTVMCSINVAYDRTKKIVNWEKSGKEVDQMLEKRQNIVNKTMSFLYDLI